MAIQWLRPWTVPKRALQELSEEIDIVIELLDARAIFQLQPSDTKYNPL